MRVLQRYQIPLTLLMFMNCYMCLNSLKLNNQVLWLSDKTATPVMAIGAASSWDLDLCCDVGLLIPNGRTPSDKSGEFICLANGKCIILNYIVGSPVIWQATTHLQVIIDDTRYYAMGGDFDHTPLHL
jgi:hypothetical protein